jgi:hypothetical protein
MWFRNELSSLAEVSLYVYIPHAQHHFQRWQRQFKYKIHFILLTCFSTSSLNCTNTPIRYHHLLTDTCAPHCMYQITYHLPPRRVSLSADTIFREPRLTVDSSQHKMIIGNCWPIIRKVNKCVWSFRTVNKCVWSFGQQAGTIIRTVNKRVWSFERSTNAYDHSNG